MIIGGLFGRQ